MPTDPAYAVVLTACPNQAVADKIIALLLSQRLAACIQVLPIRSYYTWQGAAHQENELLLLIKSKSANYPAIETCIRQNHPYQVPEIIQLPIAAALPAYLDWIKEVSQ